MARRAKGGGKSSHLRIIGGEWRGRKLGFTPEEGLRPTTDRIRETLFSWLTPEVQGALCADLFAGSGALGLEALSRGARTCDFVDISRQAISQVRQHLDSLQALDRASCTVSSAEQFLPGSDKRYDIVFIDPPFGKGMVEPSCRLLQQLDLLNPGALVYVENAVEEGCPVAPTEWQEYRSKQAGGVRYSLFTTGHTDT